MASSLLLLALPLPAQEEPDLPPSQKMLVNTNVPDDGKWHFSVGIGQHPQGPFLAGMVTSPSRWGGFVGHASEATSDSKKPPIGQPGTSEFGVVSLDRQSATHAGIAFRLTRHSVFGVGYGT